MSPRGRADDDAEAPDREPTSAGPGIPVGPGLMPPPDAEGTPPAEPGDDALERPGSRSTEPDATEAELSEAEPEAPEPELSEAELEALLFVAERPLTRRELAAVCGVDRSVVDARLGDLEVSLAGRGIRLMADGDRVALATAPEAGPLIGRYVGADAVRLSPAALETLAIVAYRQPVTRSAIERIRGVDSDYTVRTLLHRRLIVELGRAETPGRPYLYGTGIDFLERFGITSLEELPALDPEAAARLVDGGADVPAEEDGLSDVMDPGSGAPGADSSTRATGPGTPVGPGREEDPTA